MRQQGRVRTGSTQQVATLTIRITHHEGGAGDVHRPWPLIHASLQSIGAPANGMPGCR
jgi:hypothetical protein